MSITVYRPDAGPLPEGWEIVGMVAIVNGTGAGFLVEREDRRRYREELDRVGAVQSGTLREFEEDV